MRIGAIAQRSGVPAKTIRFWEDEGLLPGTARTPAGYRAYDPNIVDRLGFVRSGQAAGFTLDQIRQVLEIGDSGEAPCEHVRGLIDARLAAVDARIAELEAARSHLRILAQRAVQQDPADCRGYCSILDLPKQAAQPRPRGAEAVRHGADRPQRVPSRP
jgi:MerR family Zn(II)-responsive transcriptional regulator of zntA